MSEPRACPTGAGPGIPREFPRQLAWQSRLEGLGTEEPDSRAGLDLRDPEQHGLPRAGLTARFEGAVRRCLHPRWTRLHQWSGTDEWEDAGRALRCRS